MAPMAKTMPIMAETLVNAGENKTAQESGLSTVIAARLEDTATSVARAARARVASATITTAEMPEAFRRADNPASVAVGDFMEAVVVADITVNWFRALSAIVFSTILIHSEI